MTVTAGRTLTPTGRVLDQTAYNSPEWHEQRRQGIGGSDASTIMGQNPYMSRYALWCQKTGKVAPSMMAPSEAAYWGIQLEAAVADECERRLQIEDEDQYLTIAPGSIVNVEREWMRANVDRLVMTEADSHPIAFVEVKTVGINNAKDWRPGEVGAHALWQVHHTMAVTGLPYCWVAALIAGQRFVMERIDRSPRLEALLVETEEAFWGLVQNDLPPEPDGHPSTSEVAKIRWPESDPATVLELDPGMADLLAKRESLNGDEASIKAQREEIDSVLRVAMERYETATYAGRKVLSYKSHERRSLDTLAMRKAHPDIYAEYEHVTTVRPLRIL